MLPASLPDIESEILCITFTKKLSIWFRAKITKYYANANTDISRPTINLAVAICVAWKKLDCPSCTVEPPNKGHIGTRSSVLYREVSFIRRLKCTGINRNWDV